MINSEQKNTPSNERSTTAILTRKQTLDHVVSQTVEQAVTRKYNQPALPSSLC